MTSSLIQRLASAAATVCLLHPHTLLSQSTEPSRGEVVIKGKDLYRDGHRWIPHGFYQIAFEVSPANLSRADHPFWATAQNGYTPDEYAEMQKAGADTVRIQVAQSGADPQSPAFDKAFVEKALGAVRSARAAGLTVILCVQAESHVPGSRFLDLPGDGTRRIWAAFAPQFADDHGVLFELLNEPRPQPNAQNWKLWKAAMMQTLQTVRAAGARNVVIADGLDVGQTLDGAPLLDDPQVAYASHPYALQQFGQTRQAWDEKFGNFARKAPVIITEWHFGGFFCNADTPEATVQFLQYLQEHEIGVVVGTWDWAPAGFGNARWGFPNARLSTFTNLACHQPGYGLGQTIRSWYTTGRPPKNPL